MAGFPFRWPTDPSLAALAHRTGATYCGRHDAGAAHLLSTAAFRVPRHWTLLWHTVARWRLQHDAIGMLCEMSVQPLNGPRSRRLLGVVKWGDRLPDVSPVLLMGPTRWEGPLEGPLVPPHYRRCPLPDSLRAQQIQGLSPDGAIPRLPLLPASLFPAFLAVDANLLHLHDEGAWMLLPDIAHHTIRGLAYAALTALEGVTQPALPVMRPVMPVPLVATAP